MSLSARRKSRAVDGLDDYVHSDCLAIRLDPDCSAMSAQKGFREPRATMPFGQARVIQNRIPKLTVARLSFPTFPPSGSTLSTSTCFHFNMTNSLINAARA